MLRLFHGDFGPEVLGGGVRGTGQVRGMAPAVMARRVEGYVQRRRTES